MPGSSPGSLGPVAGKNLVHQNGSLMVVKKAPPTSAMSSSNNNNNNRSSNPMARAARGSITSAWQDSRTNLLEKLDRRSPDVPPATDHQARQMSAYRRWLSRNNATKVGQKQGVDGRSFNSRLQPKYRETPGAAAILYLGIGMIVVGLVFTFVGLGDKVFHTLELQLIGPSLIAMGFAVCGIRVLICACAGKCSYCDRAIADDGPSRRQSVDASDESWRPASWSPKERHQQSSSSAIGRRPPTPARITLERDTDGVSSTSSSFQDISDPHDLLSLQSEDSSDFSLSEFQEIELRNPPPEHVLGMEGEDVNGTGQKVMSQEQDVRNKDQDVWDKEQDVRNKEQDVKDKEQDVRDKEQDVNQKEKEANATSSSQNNKSVGKLEKKLSEGVILNVNALQEARGSGVTPAVTEEDGPASDHSWNLAMDII